MNDLPATTRIEEPVYRPRTERDGFERLSAIIKVGSISDQINFETRDAVIANGIEAFIPVALIAAMTQDTALVTDSRMSPRIIGNLDRIQDALLATDESLSRVVTHIPPRRPEAEPGAGTGLFFSGGVDSFFTLLEKSEEITHLIFVNGFDISLENEKLATAASEMARRVAQHFGKELICVNTNLRVFGEKYALWGMHLHGPALAAVSHLLSSQLQRVIIAGEVMGDFLNCSRGDLDRLWSSETIHLECHGEDVTRVEKLKRIGSESIVQHCLRVCWENLDGSYNCCRCSKCLRNMAALRAHGYLDSFSAFPKPLDLNRLARVRLPKDRFMEHVESGVREMLAITIEKDADSELRDAFQACLGNQDQIKQHYAEWTKRSHEIGSEITEMLQDSKSLILVDENKLGALFGGDNRVIPFTERNGKYWGLPGDEEAAMAEFERLSGMGADRIAFVQSATWILERFTGFHEYLRGQFECLRDSEDFVVFDLQRTASLGTDSVSEYKRL